MSEQATTQLDTFTLRSFDCNNCAEKFTSRAEALNHIWSEHVVTPDILTRCDTCSESFSNQDDARAHQRTIHAPEMVAVGCTRCDYTADTVEAVTAHHWSSHERETSYIQKMFNCPDCSDGSPTRFRFVRHVSDVHGLSMLYDDVPEDESTCPVCRDTLADHEGMLQHLSTKHRGQFKQPSVYGCSLCNETYTDPDNASTHLLNEHVPISNIDTAVPCCSKCHYRNHDENAVAKHATSRHFTTTHECPDCDVTGNRHDTVARHYWFTHVEDGSSLTRATENTIPRNETLEALYNINKHAKKYARLGTENYNKGKKTTAKANSIKKNALYTLKDAVLKRIYKQANNVGIHVIDGSEFYYFDFEDWSFHSPRDKFTLPDAEFSDDDRERLDNFNVTAEKEHSDKYLKECLLFFEEEFDLNANKFLSQERLYYGHQSCFIGWKYL